MIATQHPAIYYTTLSELPEGLLILGKDIHSLESRFPLEAVTREPYVRQVIFESTPVVSCQDEIFFLRTDTGCRLGHTYDLRLSSTYEKLRGNYNPDEVRFLVDAYHLFLGSATFRKREGDCGLPEKKPKRSLLEKTVRRLQNSHPDSIRFIMVGSLLRECKEMIELIISTISYQSFEESLPKTASFPAKVRENLVHCGSIISWLYSKCLEEDPAYLGVLPRSSQPFSCFGTPYRKIWEAYWHVSMIPSLIIHTIEAEKWEVMESLRPLLISQHVRNLRGEVRSTAEAQTVSLNICLTLWLIRLFQENRPGEAHQVAHWARHTLPLIYYHKDVIRSHVIAGQYPSLQDTICVALASQPVS